MLKSNKGRIKKSKAAVDAQELFAGVFVLASTQMNFVLKNDPAALKELEQIFQQHNISDEVVFGIYVKRFADCCRGP